MKKRSAGNKIQINADNLKDYALLQFAEGFSKFAAIAPKWGALAFLAYQLRYAITELAGKETLALIKAGVSYEMGRGSGGWFNVACLLLCVLGVGYGLFQRWMRSRQIQMDTEHFKRLERLIDKKRSSSNLTSKGKTNPSDK